MKKEKNIQEFRGWKLDVELEPVQAPASSKINHGEGRVNSIPEPTQKVRLHLVQPDGSEKTFPVTLYTLCHGENPKIILGEPSGWAADEADGDQAVGVWFPDGTLNIFPDFRILWED
jgi:hypothetical protein